VLAELARIAFSDIRELFDEKGNLKALQDLTPDQAAAIAVFEHRNLTAGNGAGATIYKIRLWDKIKALEMLFKHLGLLKESVAHAGAVEIRWMGDD
jgi:phage terminase small subunit